MQPQDTLAAIVGDHPATAAVLEAHGLDYCCGGAQRLEAACAASGLDVNEVLAALTSVADEPAPAWAHLDVGDLVDHIEATHHRLLHAEVPRLVALADKVAGVHGERHPELDEVASLVHDLQADLEPHLAKEERILFPMIRRLVGTAPPAEAADPALAPACTSVATPIEVMRREHDATGEILERIRVVTGGYAVPEDGCASYRALYDGLAVVEADTHLHVHKENNVLFPQAIARAEATTG